MPPESEPNRVAASLLDGLDEATVVSAMSPCQPDRLLRALITVSRRTGVRLTLLVADLRGDWAFLDGQAESDARADRLRLVCLAGTVPRRLSRIVDYYPHSLYDIDRFLASGTFAADVFVARARQTGPGNRLSFGEMVGYSPSALRAVDRAGFEVSTNPAPVASDYLVPDSVASLVFRSDDRPAPTAIPRASSGQQDVPTDRARIGRFVAELVPDAATIQLGVGAVPEAVVSHLGGKRDLGLHSGILPGSLLPLIIRGVANGDAKTWHRGLHVATGVLAQAADGDASWGPNLRLEPVSVTHSPDVLRRQRRLWSINSAFEIDLLGQVNGEFISGLRVASGGGQTDFFHAAHLSDGGAAVLALPSRTAKGRSRIVATLNSPFRVTSSAADLDYVVTEFGVAHLTGATAADRARQLIAIAHPDHRDTLRREWTDLYG
jgi:acyl-CoA hydrolase